MIPMCILPHVPGHELAGEIAAVGRNVQRWKPASESLCHFAAAVAPVLNA
jgi:alcohol dehydrogenase